MRLDRLIAASFSKSEAQAYRNASADRGQTDPLGSVGTTVLQDFLPVPEACAMMSAVYATRMRVALDAPAYVVAGSLFADGTRVFGGDRVLTGADFDTSNSSWDGHVWLMLGGYVADVSLMRTVKSGHAPPALSALAAREFSPNAGLVIVRWSDARKSGLTYSPSYVLTENQVATLSRSAGEVLPQIRPSQS